MNWLFIAVSFVVVVVVVVVVVFFLLPRSLCFFHRDDPPRRFFPIICSRPAIRRISSPSSNASGQLKKLVHNSARGSSSGWFLQKLDIWLLDTMDCHRATIVCLDAKGLWKLGHRFILAGFTFSLPCSAPCRTEQITIDTGCGLSTPGQLCWSSSRLQLFQNNYLIKLAIIRPST